jgi:hypothetical protein
MRKTGGGRVRLSKSACDGGGGKNCDRNYSGCLDPNAGCATNSSEPG